MSEFEFEDVILLEGPDGSGKTSTVNWLVENYGYHPVKLPTPGSDFEAMIFNKAKHKWADIRHKALCAVMDFCNAMGKAHNAGHKKIVLDRGPLSTLAYQSPEHATWALEVVGAHPFVRAINTVILLMCEPEIGLAREDGKNEVSEAGLEFHKEVYRKYQIAETGLRLLQDVRALEAKHGVKIGTRSLIQSMVEKETANPQMADGLMNFFAMDWELRDVVILDTGKIEQGPGLLEIKRQLGWA